MKVPDIPGMFTTFKANNTPLFVDGQQFYVPQHYGKIMGYDKPLNLRYTHDDADTTGSETASFNGWEKDLANKDPKGKTE